MHIVQDYHFQWLVVTAIIVFYFSISKARAIVGWLPALTMFYFCLSALNIWISSTNRYISVEAYDQQAIRFFAADSIGKLLIVVWPILLLARHRNFRVWGMVAATIFSIIDSAVVISQFLYFQPWCTIGNSCGGIVGNPSMNACFLVTMMPLVLKSTNPVPRAIAFFMSLFAVLVSGSSIAFGMLASLAVIYTIVSGWWWLLAFAPVAMAAGWKLCGEVFFNSGDRFLMWEFFMSKWAVPANLLTGTGYGTFGVFSNNLQRHFQVREGVWWVWMHNDWLQGVFEAGIVGISLMVSTYLLALYRLIYARKHHEATAFILYGIFMGANYPMHLAPTALFGAWLTILALRKPSCLEGAATSY